MQQRLTTFQNGLLITMAEVFPAFGGQLLDGFTDNIGRIQSQFVGKHFVTTEINTLPVFPVDTDGNGIEDPAEHVL